MTTEQEAAAIENSITAWERLAEPGEFCEMQGEITRLSGNVRCGAVRLRLA